MLDVIVVAPLAFIGGAAVALLAARETIEHYYRCWKRSVQLVEQLDEENQNLREGIAKPKERITNARGAAQLLGRPMRYSKPPRRYGGMTTEEALRVMKKIQQRRKEEAA